MCLPSFQIDNSTATSAVFAHHHDNYDRICEIFYRATIGIQYRIYIVQYGMYAAFPPQQYNKSLNSTFFLVEL